MDNTMGVLVLVYSGNRIEHYNSVLPQKTDLTVAMVTYPHKILAHSVLVTQAGV